MSSTLYSILFSIELIILIVFLNSRLKGNLVNLAKRPIYIALIFNFFIGIFVPFLQFNSQYYRYQSTYDLTVIFTGNLLVIISLVMLFLGYIATNKNTVTNVIEIPKKQLLIIVTVFLILPSIYAAFTYLSSISSIGYDKYIADRIKHGSSQGYLKAFIGNLYVSIIFLYINFLTAKFHKRKRLYIILFSIAIFMYFIYYQVITANRNSIFILLLALFIVSYRFKEKVNIKKSVVLVLVSFILILLFSEAAKWRKEAALDQSTNESSLTTLTKGLNGAFGNHENILWLLDNEFEHKYGATYIAAFLNVIPRSIWSQKPNGGGPALVNTIYPGKYVQGGEKNSSLTTGLNTEAFLNFGYLGVLIMPFLLGMLISYLKVLFLQSKNIISLTLTTVFLLSFTVLVMYSEFLGLIARTGLTFAPLFLIYLFFYKLRFKIKL